MVWSLRSVLRLFMAIYLSNTTVWKALKNKVLCYTRRCNVIYADKNGTALHSPIFFELATAERFHAQISRSEFHPNRKISVESVGRN
jgi:hypothetical protein